VKDSNLRPWDQEKRLALSVELGRAEEITNSAANEGPQARSMSVRRVAPALPCAGDSIELDVPAK